MRNIKLIIALILISLIVGCNYPVENTSPTNDTSQIDLYVNQTKPLTINDSLWKVKQCEVNQMGYYEYKATLIRVIDGDTVDLDVDVGFGIHFQERFRLAGINTPEIHGVKKESEEYKKGMVAKEVAKEFVLSFIGDKELVIRTEKDEKGKYGRYIATILVGDNNLNEILITEKLAERYPK